MKSNNFKTETNLYTLYYQSIENDWINSEMNLMKVYTNRKLDFTWCGFKVCFVKSGVRIFQYGCLIIRIRQKSGHTNDLVINALRKHFYLKAWQN
jgi:hypothetical protein